MSYHYSGQVHFIGEKTIRDNPHETRECQAELEELYFQMRTMADLLYASDPSQSEIICLKGLGISLGKWADQLRKIEYKL